MLKIMEQKVNSVVTHMSYEKQVIFYDVLISVGDGNSDDTEAITNALSQDRNFQPNTQTPAFVYFPPGVYKITKVIF